MEACNKPMCRNYDEGEDDHCGEFFVPMDCLRISDSFERVKKYFEGEQKPIRKQSKTSEVVVYYCCSICDSRLHFHSDRAPNFCSECGTKIDWKINHEK